LKICERKFRGSTRSGNVGDYWNQISFYGALAWAIDFGKPKRSFHRLKLILLVSIVSIVKVLVSIVKV